MIRAIENKIRLLTAIRENLFRNRFRLRLGQTSTGKKESLQQIDRIMPWSEWIGIIEPHYYKG